MRSAGLAAAVVAFVVMLAASVALAVQEELLEKARALVVECKPFVLKANDVDLPMLDRRAPRKEAFTRLKEARGLYDRYLDANPAMEEKLDKEYVEMMVLLHGIKKDSSLGELEKDDEPPAAATPPPVARGPPSAKEALAAVRDFEKSHAGDLPQIQRLYAKFLADFPDTSLPEYADAAERLGKVSDRIKSVFQAAAKRDFDSISGSDTKDEKAVVKHLAADLSAKDPAVRTRAARLLAATRSRAATYSLARGIADRDPEFARICRDGLVAIGGTSAGDNLAMLFCVGPKADQVAALAVLRALVDKGGSEPANQSRAVGRFTLSMESDVAAQAFDLLKSMGKVGGPGLLVALLGTGDIDKKAAVMAKMAEAKCCRSAGYLAQQFLVAPNGDAGATQLYNATAAAIVRMGVYAVPYLVDALSGPSGRHVAIVLSKITGTRIEVDEQQKVRDWWDVHKPKDAD